jgi:metal-responsive CopG/Arc/MetJ family transcriptional regulator
MPTVKTAISIDKDLFNEINQLALKTHLSRSQVFSQAAEYVIHKNENLSLFKKLNAAYGIDPSSDEVNRAKRAKKYHAKMVKETWR